MTEEDNKNVVLKYVEAFNRADYEALREVVAMEWFIIKDVLIQRRWVAERFRFAIAADGIIGLTI